MSFQKLDWEYLASQQRCHVTRQLQEHSGKCSFSLGRVHEEGFSVPSNLQREGCWTTMTIVLCQEDFFFDPVVPEFQAEHLFWTTAPINLSQHEKRMGLWVL